MKNPEWTQEIAHLHILVVEDEEDSRKLLSYALGLCGAEIRLASSASEAFQFLLNEKFDIIISDIAMPREDGLSFIKRVRELRAEQGGETPAIALTAYNEPEDHKKALRSGFQMHISKPVELSKLIAAIAMCVNKN